MLRYFFSFALSSCMFLWFCVIRNVEFSLYFSKKSIRTVCDEYWFKCSVFFNNSFHGLTVVFRPVAQRFYDTSFRWNWVIRMIIWIFICLYHWPMNISFKCLRCYELKYPKMWDFVFLFSFNLTFFLTETYLVFPRCVHIKQKSSI